MQPKENFIVNKKQKMKKNIALLLGLVLGLGFVSCSSDDDDDESINGEGKYLAEKLITRYDWKDGKRSDEGKLYEINRYNENGDFVGGDRCTYGYRVDVLYDDKGDLSEEISYDLNDLNSIIDRWKIERKYTDSGVVVSSYQYNWKNKLVLTYIREFSKESDSDYKLTKWTHIIDSIGKNHGQVYTYSYSGNTETIEVTNLDDGSFSEKIVHELDSHGNVTKTTSTHAGGGTSVSKYEYEYDSHGRLVKKTGPIYVSASVFGYIEQNAGYVEYTYNDDGTIWKEHYVDNVSVYNMDKYIQKEYDLEYTYKYKKK